MTVLEHYSFRYQLTNGGNSQEQIPMSVFHDSHLFVSFFTRSNAYRRRSLVFFRAMPWEDVVEFETFIASYKRSEIRWERIGTFTRVAHDSWNNHWERWVRILFSARSLFFLHVYTDIRCNSSVINYKWYKFQKITIVSRSKNVLLRYEELKIKSMNYTLENTWVLRNFF